MPWPYSAGEILTNTNLNAATRPNNAICIASRASQGLSDATVTAIAFTDADTLDPLLWHDPAGLSERIIPTIAGYYRITCAMRLATAAVDISRIIIQPTKNGTAIQPGEVDLKPDTTAGNSSAALTTTAWASINGVGDYVGFQGYQDNTASTSRTMAFWIMVELIHWT